MILMMILACEPDTGSVNDLTVDLTVENSSTTSNDLLAGLSNTSSEDSECGVWDVDHWLGGFYNSLTAWVNTPDRTVGLICSGEPSLNPWAVEGETTAMSVLEATSCEQFHEDSQADACFTLSFSWEQ